jgi:hypothetical protein
VSECLGVWSWLDDPRPDEPGAASRVLATQQHPRLMYGRTIWRLLHDAVPTEPPGETALGYHLRLDASVSTLVGFPGAPFHLAQEARLRRAIEPLFVADDDPPETEASVEALLDAAGTAIDTVLG